MIRIAGLSEVDLKRTKRWKAWIESYFTEIGKAIGASNSKGAHRWFGDFEFWYDPMEGGFIHLFVVTKASLAKIHRAIIMRWELVEPVEAAKCMLVKLREIQAHPMYVVSKRAAQN